MRRPAIAVALCLATGLFAMPDPGAAAGRTTSRQASSNGAPTEPPGPPEPLIAVVSIGEQQIEVFGAGGSQTRSRVSTGTSGHDTPTGVFSILQRNRYHESNIYSNAPMPFMQRLTWSGIALHEGYVPGYRASHGCIRLPSGFASALWAKGRLGMRVIVSPSRVAPVSFSHPRLPLPAVAQPIHTAALVQVATSVAMPSPVERALTPYDAAQMRLTNALAAKLAAEKALKPAFDLAAAKASESNRLAAATKAAAGILTDADEQLELDQLGMGTVQTESAEAIVRARIEVSKDAVAAARDAHDRLKQAEAPAYDEAFATARAAREAQAAIEVATTELSQARKAISPIQVFVSRKTGQVYVRQGWSEVYDGPVAIADPDRPLGTHVFTVMQETDAAAVRWSAVTVPTSGGESARRGRNESVAAARPSSAAEALDRIELPEDVRNLMSERLWPGASLIVSDYGLGETSENTDFVITTR